MSRTLGMTHGWNKTRGVRPVLPTVPGEGHERVGEIREMREIHGRRAHPQFLSEKGGLIGVLPTLGVPLPTLGVTMLTLGLRHPPEHLVHGPDVDYTIDSRILGLMLGEALEMADWPQMAGFWNQIAQFLLARTGTQSLSTWRFPGSLSGHRALPGLTPWPPWIDHAGPPG